MIDRMKWVDRKFDFGSPASLAPELLERLRGAPARLAERVEGLPEDLDLPQIGAAKADFPSGANDRDLGGFQVDQMTTDPLARNGVDARDQPAQRLAWTANGALALHGDDAVNDRQRGPDVAIDID